MWGRSNLPQKSPTVPSEPKFGPPLSKIPESAPDSHLQGITKLECENNVQATTKFFNSLGLYVQFNFRAITGSRVSRLFLKFHDHDCHFVSYQGGKYHTGLQRSFDQNTTYHQGSAVVIGKLVASCPGVAMVPLFYRQLKKEKTVPLKFHHGNFDESIALSPVAESDLQW